MPRRFRRQFLQAAALAGTGTLAGCASLTGGGLAHYVEVFNRTDTAHNVFVRVDDDAGKALYRRSFRLEADSAEEATDPFEGDPATITVFVDDSPPVERAWPANRCDQRGVRSAGGVELGLRADGVHTRLSCDTITVE